MTTKAIDGYPDFASAQAAARAIATRLGYPKPAQLSHRSTPGIHAPITLGTATDCCQVIPGSVPGTYAVVTTPDAAAQPAITALGTALPDTVVQPGDGVPVPITWTAVAPVPVQAPPGIEDDPAPG